MLCPFYDATSSHTVLWRAEHSFCRFWAGSIFWAHSCMCFLQSCLFSYFARIKHSYQKENCACIKAYIPGSCWPSALSSFLSTNTQQRKPVQLQAAQEILIPALQEEEVGRTYNHLIPFVAAHFLVVAHCGHTHLLSSNFHILIFIFSFV